MPFRRREKGPLPTPEQLEVVLGALGELSRTSLHYLRLVTVIAESVLAGCVACLGEDGLLAAEDHSDCDDPRRMVEITAAGRRRFRALSRAEGAREAVAVPSVFGDVEGSGGIPEGTA